MSLWDKLPVIKTGGIDVWERVSDDLEQPASLEAGLGVWAQVGYFPAGFWNELGEETVILRRKTKEQEDIWRHADKETLIVKRDLVKDLWESSEDQLDSIRALGRQGIELWQELEDETLIIPRYSDTIWSAPKIRDASNYKPRQALGWALKELTTSKGEPYWILKNLRQDTYLRLNEQQVYWWNLLDGDHNVQDLAVANFLKYQTLSYESLMGFLGQLHSRGFLASVGVNVYQATGAQVQQQGLNYWVKRVIHFLIGSEWSIRGVDRFYSAFYRFGGRIFFTLPVVLSIYIISLLGLPIFLFISKIADVSFLVGTTTSLGLGLVGLYIAEIIAIFVHESAHALTTKHYGRTVRRGGAGLYYGMVVFFMDTTDIWMEPRNPRLAVTWAGPLSGFFLGGLASLYMLAKPPDPWAGIAYQLIVFCYGISLLNLNPLLKLDGYYILMDWLEMPMLREKALSFVQGELWRKLRRRESFSKEDRIYAIFGVLSLAWTVFVTFTLFRVLGGLSLSFFQGVLGQFLGLLATVVLILVLAGALLWPYLRSFLAGRGIRKFSDWKRLLAR